MTCLNCEAGFNWKETGGPDKKCVVCGASLETTTRRSPYGETIRIGVLKEYAMFHPVKEILSDWEISTHTLYKWINEAGLPSRSTIKTQMLLDFIDGLGIKAIRNKYGLGKYSLREIIGYEMQVIVKEDKDVHFLTWDLIAKKYNTTLNQIQKIYYHPFWID